MNITTTYKKLHGELEGKFKANYRDDGIRVDMYADNFDEIHRAVTFLKLRRLDKEKITAILEDTHGRTLRGEG